MGPSSTSARGSRRRRGGTPATGRWTSRCSPPGCCSCACPMRTRRGCAACERSSMRPSTRRRRSRGSMRAACASTYGCGRASRPSSRGSVTGGRLRGPSRRCAPSTSPTPRGATAPWSTRSRRTSTRSSVWAVPSRRFVAGTTPTASPCARPRWTARGARLAAALRGATCSGARAPTADALVLARCFLSVELYELARRTALTAGHPPPTPELADVLLDADLADGLAGRARARVVRDGARFPAWARVWQERVAGAPRRP